MIIYMAKVTKDGKDVDVLTGKPMSDRVSLEKNLFKRGFRIIDTDTWEGKGKMAEIFQIQI